VQVADDKTRNTLVTTESYSIADIASKADQDGKHTVWVETPDVDELLKDPPTKIRHSPLELAPVEVSQTTEVLLPEAWDLKTSDERVDDPAFSFHRTVSADDNHRRLVIHDEYRTLADEVAAREMGRYTANLAKARNDLGYSLTWSDELAPPPTVVSTAAWFDRLNWPVSLLVLAACAVFVPLARRAWRYDPAPRAEAVPALAGMRGWLLLYTLSVLAIPAQFAWWVYSMLGRFAMPQWSSLTAFGGADYHPGWAPVLLFELLAQLALLAAALLLAVLYFRRRSSYPRLAVAFFAAVIVFKLADFALAGWLPAVTVSQTMLEEFARFALGASVWSAYLLLSERVRSTFVRRLHADIRPALEAVSAASASAPPPPPAPQPEAALYA
jgi:hypothetical protein